MNFETIPNELLFSRNDASDPRRGEHVQVIQKTPSQPGVVIAGYPDDEGIRNNGGRPGANEAPNVIRKFLYKMVADSTPTYDAGNLVAQNAPIRERHELVRKHVVHTLSAGHRHIGLGGGHDYAYADGAGFLDWAQKHSKLKPLIINFDAHLDVRPDAKSVNSGTAFFRLDQHDYHYDFAQIGIQTQCNAKTHLEWSRSKGHILVTLSDYWNSRVTLDEFVIKQLGDLLLQHRPCFISVDIDAFASPFALGSSQSWPTGLEPKEFWPCFQLLQKRLDVRAMGIYETSPPLDFDFATSKLAALIADTYIREIPREL